MSSLTECFTFSQMRTRRAVIQTEDQESMDVNTVFLNTDHVVIKFSVRIVVERGTDLCSMSRL